MAYEGLSVHVTEQNRTRRYDTHKPVCSTLRVLLQTCILFTVPHRNVPGYEDFMGSIIDRAIDNAGSITPKSTQPVVKRGRFCR